ncbi:MAG: hypothetical protein ACYC63_05240 [Armatimonadota bacterium]
MSNQFPPILRPLNIADILDQSIRLYRQNFVPFVGIIALVYIPVGIMQIIFAYAMGDVATLGSETPDQVPWAQFATLGMAGGGMLLVNLIAIPIGQGALTIAVSRRYLNEPVTIADAYRSIGARWPLLIAAVLLVSLLVLTGMLFCIIPGIYVAVLLLIVTPIIVIEGLGPVDAMKRSAALVKDDWWRCFGIYMLLTLLVSLITQAVAWPVAMASMAFLMEKNMALAQAINQGMSVAVQMLVQPVLITGLVLLYYDLRVRKEGFDLELLAQAMGSPVPSPEVKAPLYGIPPPPPVPPGWASPPPPPALEWTSAPLPPPPAPPEEPAPPPDETPPYFRP